MEVGLRNYLPKTLCENKGVNGSSVVIAGAFQLQWEESENWK